MIYQSEHMTLNSVMDVFRGKVNDVVICENIKDGRSSYYTVLVVKDHVIVKKLVRILKEQENDCCVDMFNWENNFCLVFDYVKERKLYDFYMAGGLSLENCEEICINLIIQCMISGLPYPLVYLVLEQRQLHLLKDNSVALGYALDLEKLDENCTQDQCTMQCAIILRELLKQKTTKKNVGYKLLLKKIPKQSYRSFRELYKDIQLCASSFQKRSIRQKIGDFSYRNQSTFFKIILVVSLILMVLAVIMLISDAVWGEIPFLRIFYNNFTQIGTESLLK